MTAAASPTTPSVDTSAAALRLLYEQHGRPIFNFCLHRLGSREDAEDALQTTFLNAFRGLARGMLPRDERAWLFAIAQNVVHDRNATSWKRRRVESDADLDVVAELIPSPGADSSELFGLGDALAGMPETQRRAILLREWQGLSYREIGETLGLSQSAVETLIFRARRSLAQGLEAPPLKKRRLASGIDLSSVLAALKSLLSGGAIVKAVAIAAAAGTATIVATKTVDRPALHHAKPVVPAHESAPAVQRAPAAPTSVAVAPPVVTHAAPAVVHHAAKHHAPKTKPEPPHAVAAVAPPVAPAAQEPTPVAAVDPPAPAEPAAKEHGKSAEAHGKSADAAPVAAQTPAASPSDPAPPADQGDNGQGAGHASDNGLAHGKGK
jgi:RNA polymerase sigma factor (sigma-70 family)